VLCALAGFPIAVNRCHPPMTVDWGSMVCGVLVAVLIGGILHQRRAAGRRRSRRARWRDEPLDAEGFLSTKDQG